MPRRISPQARRRRSFTVLAAILVILVGAWSWFAVTKIYFPRLDSVPEGLDVIVQLGGAYNMDYMAARQLAKELNVPDLVISEPTGLQPRHDRYCGPLDGVDVHCFAPEPSTTRGEARGFAALAEEHGWRTAFVMGTGREHTERVRLYFSRCWDGTLAVNRPASGRSVSEHLRQGFYQSAGWARALTYRGC